ncbi:MAG: GerAB/ArcD/ProY family transporter [Hominimerdicola sp.]
MNKISPFQLAALMLCGRCVAIMSYSPYEITNPLILIIATLISTAIQLAMIMPIMFFRQKFPIDSPCTLAFAKNRISGIIITFLYMIFFMASAFLILGDFVYLMDFYLANFLPRFVIVAIITISAFYIAKMNVSVFGKSACFVLAGFIIFTIIIVFSSGIEFHTENFYTADRDFRNSVLTEIKNELARNRMLVLFVFLLPDLKGSAAKCGFTYLAVKLVIVEVVLSFIVMILGDFVMISKLPFFYLAAYSKTQIVERYDSVFMSIWIIMSLLKISAYFHCSGKCLKMIIPKVSKNWSIIITGTISAGASLVLLLQHRWEKLSHYSGNALYLTLLVTVIPLIMLFLRKEQTRANEKS